MSKQQTLETLEKKYNKDSFINAMIKPLWSEDSEVIDSATIKLTTFILKTAADLVGFKDDYEKFKLVAVSAWENDETHVRHLSCTNEFNIAKLDKPGYTNTMAKIPGRVTYKKGTSWQPGIEAPPATGGNSWTSLDIDDVLDYVQLAVLNYYLGTPANSDYKPNHVTGRKYEETPQPDKRYQASNLIGCHWGMDSFIYHLAELKTEDSFSSEGAVIEIQLSEEGSDYNVTHKGNAYITSPELVIDVSDYSHLGENVYI